MLDSMLPTPTESFGDLLARFKAATSVGSDDVIGAVRGLLEEVCELHAEGRVAALERIDLLELTSSGDLALGHVPVAAPSLSAEVALIDLPASDAVAIVRDVHVNDDGASITSRNRAIAAPDQMPDRPMFYPSYGSWERILGHHDPLTDIFHLGLVMGSLATQLDFRETSELATFVQHRTNLLRLNPRLHPVLARVIAGMTELSRQTRAADLEALIEVLDSYRSVEVDDALAKAGEVKDLGNPQTRRQFRLAYFRNRLFEVTRRNKLLYFSDRHGVDLTRGSFPLMLNYRTLQPRQLLTASPDFLAELQARNPDGEPVGSIDLRRWLQTVDYPFLPGDLDKLRAAARRDQREVGFNQLRLVLAFLRWHDDDREDRISTPLVMIPVSLKKIQGTADGFSLSIEGSVAEAEVNPVLRYVFSERFRIELPETLDLCTLDPLMNLRAEIERAIRRVKPGVAIAVSQKPKIHLIQKTIKRQLDDHRRRVRRGGQRLKDWEGIGYSYAADSYQPLGMELFDRFVRPKPAPGRELAGGSVDATTSFPGTAAEHTMTAEAYAFESVDLSDPLNWEIDLCAVTLANFNTRKMSLVRDYRELLNGYDGSHRNYERLFEHGVRPDFEPLVPSGAAARSFVLPADPSQSAAIVRAAGGESYVIQGPPGTGKSQTIANLLVSLAAAGKSVLFVCEKRVALDVVFDRLRDAGVGELACLMHDAREDRLPFITDLKGLYQDWQGRRLTRTVSERRARLLAEIAERAARLEAFSKHMQAPAGRSATVRGLMDRVLEQRWAPPALSHRDRECLPTWDAFVAGEPALTALEYVVAACACERPSVAALVRALNGDLADMPRPLASLQALLPEARTGLAAIEAVLAAGVRSDSDRQLTVAMLTDQARLAARLRGIVEAGKLGVLDPLAPETITLKRQLEELAQLDLGVGDLRSRNQAWLAKPGLQDTMAALAVARRHEGRFWSFLWGEWRQVKRLVAEKHRGGAASVVETLEQLLAEQQAQAARNEHAGRLQTLYGLADPTDVQQVLQPIWQGRISAAELSLVEVCLKAPSEARRIVAELGAAHMRLSRARDTLAKLFSGTDGATVADIGQWLTTLETLEQTAVDLVRRVRALDTASPLLAEAWRQLAIDPATMRAATLHGTIAMALDTDPVSAALTTADITTLARDIEEKLGELRQLNAKAALEAAVGRFKAKVASGDAAYDAGRGVLEHQFSLQRPSAAMRTLLGDEQGQVIRDLKPIWMMSPLSVADTLPLKENLFDVVVFDEASQIPIEDALPSLYRAPQAIVVGDDMQLPPPSYFAKRFEADTEELPDYIAFGMQAESLLDKSLHALPATRLEWHYRSRHEALIGFCNQAFYSGRLKTVPSRQVLEQTPAVDTSVGGPMKAMAQRVLGRPISFHRIDGGVFDRQRNEAEAIYIAGLVKSLLAQDVDRSIGVVAFSQPQQVAIEEALETAARDDDVFRKRLERAYGLEQDELFVKNLENVQGDERDVIIVSIAYAPAPTGRMIMNFGPINQEGGEKRLNVIFSRAKHHVAVVASIDPAHITNDYNKGANALKRYLMYARAASVGDLAGMRDAVAVYPGAEHVELASRLADPLADLVAEVIVGEGRGVVRGLGQSTVRCDVAVREPGASAFSTAILTDNANHYEIEDIVDRYVTIPALLRGAGWDVQFALAKDWIGPDKLRPRAP